MKYLIRSLLVILFFFGGTAVHGSLQAQVVPGEEKNPTGILWRSYGLPDPDRTNQLADSIRTIVVFKQGDLLSWVGFAHKLQTDIAGERSLPPSLPKKTRDRWILMTIGLLVLFAGVLRVVFPTDIALFVRAYYDRSLLKQINKEDHIFSSWSFAFSYVLFGLSAGLFIYVSLASGVFDAVFYRGAGYFLLISLFVMLLFGLKIIVIRLIGFIFDISKLLYKYVTVLYLAYFNTGIILLIAAIMISLVPHPQAFLLVWIAAVWAGALLLLRVTQAIGELIGNYQFPKFYLFMYLCTLEIAPVLILIKVLYR